jgi:hypothetical protein
LGVLDVSAEVGLIIARRKIEAKYRKMRSLKKRMERIVCSLYMTIQRS